MVFGVTSRNMNTSNIFDATIGQHIQLRHGEFK